MSDKIKLWYYKYVLKLSDEELTEISERLADRRDSKTYRCKKCERVGDVIDGSPNLRYCPCCGKAWKIK